MEVRYIAAAVWALSAIIVLVFCDYCPKFVYLLAILALEMYILIGG